MTKILLTAPIPGMDELRGNHKLVVLKYPKKETVIKKIGGCVGLIPLLSFPVDRPIIDAGTELRVIANYAVGYDNIDVSYATQKGIAVLNTPDVLTRATAELTWALIFATARRLIEGDKMVRRGKFKDWKPDLLLGLELKGSTLGVVGAGRIGSEVARIGLTLGLNVLYFDINRNKILEKEGVHFSYLENLLQKSDIITLHLPLTRTTRHIIDKEKFRLLKDGAVLINTGRGPLIDEQALIKHLEAGKIRAGLDVYEYEPAVPKELKKLDNVVLLPHVGSATEKARYAMAEITFEGIQQVLDGKKPKNCINPEIFE